jgi:hypothetical protein
MSASAILKLQKVGFTTEQVEALADFMDTQSASKADVEAATHKLDKSITSVRSDLDLSIAAVRSELENLVHKVDMSIAGVKGDLRLVESGLRAEMKQIEQRSTIKIGTMMVVAVGILLAAMRFMLIH